MSIEHETIDETKFPMPWCHISITSVSSRLQSGEYLGQSHVLSFFLSNAHEYSWLISRSPSEMTLSFSCDWSFRFSSIPNHVKEIPTLPDCLRTEITIYWIHISFIYFYQEYSKDILYSQCGLQRQWLTESWIPTPCQALDQMSWARVLSDTGDSFLSSQHLFSIKSLNVV